MVLLVRGTHSLCLKLNVLLGCLVCVGLGGVLHRGLFGAQDRLLGGEWKRRYGVLGLTGCDGQPTCAKQKKLYFQTSFLDGLIDLPTSIYWCNPCSRGGWQSARASGIDGGQFPTG